MFQLHAYLLFKLGNIIAVEKFMKIKGHNGIFPCRSCNIQARRGDGWTYYVPLRPPKNSCNIAEEAVEWDPQHLPLRRHDDFVTSATRIATATSKAAKAQIAKETGIKGLPRIRRVKSLDYAQCMYTLGVVPSPTRERHPQSCWPLYQAVQGLRCRQWGLSNCATHLGGDQPGNSHHSQTYTSIVCLHPQ